MAELAASFLKFAEAETPKRETEARLGRLFKHLKLARDFDLLATGLISTSIIAETAVQNTVKKALTSEASSKFAEAVKEYLRRMEHAGQMSWGAHTDFIVENIRQLKLAAGRLTGPQRGADGGSWSVGGVRISAL